jgi:hypothetical protein
MKWRQGYCRRQILLAAILFITAGCTPVNSASLPAPTLPAPGATVLALPTQTRLTATAAAEVPRTAATPAPTMKIFPTATFDPARWMTLPVLPVLSPRARAVLQDGLARGRNPRAFSKLGDCESQAYWFLGELDQKAKYYALGPYEQDLAPVVDYYQGSFARVSLAAQPGFSAASLMAPIWADKQQCQKGETPIACEFRVHNPLVTFIMLGSNDASNPKTFERHMRRAIEYSLEQGVLPILGTKADNVEGNHLINSTIARLAYEYELPLWNYWLAVQDLPGKGLQEDGVHLTFGTIHFDDPQMMKQAWTVRNLNALQVLKVMMDE